MHTYTHILDTSHLSDTYFMNIFFKSMVFHFLKHAKAKAFNFDEVKFIYFSFLS